MTDGERYSLGWKAAYCALSASLMGFAWGYRGTVGHEAGAMVPGALLGLALCIGAPRADWHRRGAVAGLFGAAGWAWGGSLSYMEHTFYVASDSFPDILYGYAMLFFLGALWAGCGGAILGMAFTLSRSDLAMYARVFAFVSGLFFVSYVVFRLNPELAEANETLTVRHFHDGDWLSATLTIVAGAVYWFVRPRDRAATKLFLAAAIGWWIGYGVLTQGLGLRLAPWHRSESWSGVLGVLVVLAVHHVRTRNTAALLLCRYGVLGGGIAFAVAVFLRHPAMANWGVFAEWPFFAGWRFSEVSFGVLMGGAMALGAMRLIQGGIHVARDDGPRVGLDVFAVFAILIALPWMNFRRHLVRWIRATPGSTEPGFLGLSVVAWILIVAAALSMLGGYILYRYYRGDRTLVPASALGKAAALTLIATWLNVVGQLFDGLPNRGVLFGHLLLWIPALIGSALVIVFATERRHRGAATETVEPADSRWRVGIGHYLVCGFVPVLLLGLAGMNASMQEAPLGGHARKRFGPDAYHVKTGRLIGTWTCLKRVRDADDLEALPDPPPLGTLSFDAYRNVIATLVDGSEVAAHRWSLMNQYTWLDWYDRAPDHAEKGRAPLRFEGESLLIEWPPGDGGDGFLLFRRVAD